MHAAALALLTSAVAAPGLDVTYFLGSPATGGDVVVVDETTLAAPAPVAGLEGIRLLPLDVLGRSTLETFLPGRARLERDVPGAMRVVLPAGAGSLYHFERDEPAVAPTAKVFGYFVVDAQGTARLLVERLGTGPAADVDPFLHAVAAAPAGDAVLVGTTLDAGGDVLELTVATALVTDRSALVPPLALAPSGLGLRASFGTVATTSGILRFERTATGQVEDLPLPGAPSWFGGEFVFSDDGLVAGTIAGSAVTSAYPFAFGATGPAVRLSQTAQHMSDVGHLPTSIDGPYFAFSADGSVAVWRTEGLARDAWTSNVALVPTPVEPVTSDPQFIDTLDEVGLAGSFALASSRAILLAVGERADPQAGGLEALDFYLVESPLAGGKPLITNLSRTSGDLVEPFGKGLIDPSQGSWRVPGTDRIVVLDDAGSGQRLSLLDLGNFVTTPLVPDADAVLEIASHGTDLLIALDRDIGPTKVHDLVRVDALAGSVQTLASLSSAAQFRSFAVRADGWTGLVLDTGNGEYVARVDLGSGAGELLTATPLAIGPTLAWTPQGRLAVSGGIPGLDPIFVGWGLGAPSFLAPIAPQPGFVLPGA